MTAAVFRDLSGMAEMRMAEDLQRQVWGEGDLPDPADLMMVIQAEGGLVAGAFAEGRLLGYIFGFPTRDPQVQHSHRLAVAPQARGLGLGARLKLYQRDWCLARGITHVRWTFDPLRALNATLNIARLGAQSGTYLEDYYGEMAGINSGLASDRLLVDWDLAAAPVAALSRASRRRARTRARWTWRCPRTSRCWRHRTPPGAGAAAGFARGLAGRLCRRAADCRLRPGGAGLSSVRPEGIAAGVAFPRSRP
ncbi:hypothetical protein MASR1M32_02630 [Rhodobacter sp.]